MIKTDEDSAIKDSDSELINGFVTLSKAWNLNDTEQEKILGRDLASSILKRKTSESLLRIHGRDRTRMATLLSIKDNIDTLYDGDRCDTYIRSPNKAFDGRSPLEIILSEPDDGLDQVKVYLMGGILGGYG